MRILHVVESIISGVGHHVSTLACQLDKQRFEVAVACPPERECSFGDNQFVPNLHRSGITVFPIMMGRAIRPASDARALGQLVQLFQRERFDVVHAHSSKAGFLGRLAARIAQTPAVVYTPHALYFLGLRSPARRRFYLLLEQLAGRFSDRIIAVSAREREVMLRYRIAPPDRIVCIHNGIAPLQPLSHDDRAALRAALGQDGDGLLIGTVARLVPQKNPHMFVEAAAQVLRQLPDARFVWCGGGELMHAAQEQARSMGIARACRFPGHREDAKQIMAALDLFWLTSNYEGMSLALLEAMALRIPVVATDVIGTRDVLGDTNGLLVPPADAAALASATIALARNPPRRARLAEAGYNYVHQYAKAEQMVRATEQVYEALVARSRHPVLYRPTV